MHRGAQHLSETMKANVRLQLVPVVPVSSLTPPSRGAYQISCHCYDLPKLQAAAGRRYTLLHDPGPIVKSDNAVVNQQSLLYRLHRHQLHLVVPHGEEKAPTCKSQSTDNTLFSIAHCFDKANIVNFRPTRSNLLSMSGQVARIWSYCWHELLLFFL